MNNGLQLVSIGMAIYNEEKYLRQALDSLLAQDYPNFELIISDNCSTDLTQAISLEYAARDTRVSYHRNETNVGATENFNRAFRLSRGEYFMWAGGHDLWAPTYISRCVEVLESDKSIVQCNSLALNMSQDGKILDQVRQIDTRGKGLLVRANLMLWQACAFLLYSLIRSSSLRETRLLCPVCGPDLLLSFELSLRGQFALVPEPLFFLRDHRGDRSRPTSRAQGSAAFFKRLHPKGRVSFGRFWVLKYALEQLRAVRGAPLSFGQRIALMGSVPPAYFVRFYPFVPAFIRRPIRGIFDRWSSPLRSSHEV